MAKRAGLRILDEDILSNNSTSNWGARDARSGDVEYVA